MNFNLACHSGHNFPELIVEKEGMHLGASGRIFEWAQGLREEQTEAEKLLWSRLSKNQVGAKFRRQHPVLNYIADFYCHSVKLVIEVDGSVHQGQQQQFHDRIRTETLNLHGITVIRFTNQEIISNLDQVVDGIKVHLNSLTKK